MVYLCIQESVIGPILFNILTMDIEEFIYIYELVSYMDNIIIIIILCSVDSFDGYARPTPLKESRHRSLWSLQITITQTEIVLLIFLQSGLQVLTYHQSYAARLPIQTQ